MNTSIINNTHEFWKQWFKHPFLSKCAVSDCSSTSISWTRPSTGNYTAKEKTNMTQIIAWVDGLSLPSALPEGADWYEHDGEGEIDTIKDLVNAIGDALENNPECRKGTIDVPRLAQGAKYFYTSDCKYEVRILRLNISEYCIVFEGTIQEFIYRGTEQIMCTRESIKKILREEKEEEEDIMWPSLETKEPLEGGIAE